METKSRVLIADSGEDFRFLMADTISSEEDMKREGISREYASLRVSAQKPNDFFEKNCNFTLSNDGTEEQFKEKCEKLFEDIIRR